MSDDIQIESLLESKWRAMTEIDQAQHMLSNSELWQLLSIQRLLIHQFIQE